ncbi:MAG TPA: hypothetical protein VI299_11270 [Polyangiales bacterium]
MGPKTISGARFDYNDAIVRSFDHQMLLNLVRMRYQDSILFLDLSSVVASYHREAKANISPSGAFKPPTGAWGALGEGLWSESPTISYVPLQGEDFAKRMLAPIQPSAILLLSRSGWGLERLLLCTVQQINELPNGTAVGGVAPMRVRHFERFRRVANILRELQEEGYIQLNNLSEQPDSVALTLGPIPPDERGEQLAREAISLLGIAGRAGAPIEVETSGFPRSPARMTMVGRSFLGVMSFLAQHVDVPDEHLKKNWAHQTRGADDKPFDWSLISGTLFHVRSGKSKPEQAYASVEYRGYWFWIDDGDIESKRTYTLLSQLFSLQAASGGVQAPVLTIPAR